MNRKYPSWWLGWGRWRNIMRRLIVFNHRIASAVVSLIIRIYCECCNRLSMCCYVVATQSEKEQNASCHLQGTTCWSDKLRYKLQWKKSNKILQSLISFSLYHHLWVTRNESLGKKTKKKHLNSLFLSDNQILSQTTIVSMTSHLWPSDNHAGNTPAKVPSWLGSTSTSGGRCRGHQRYSLLPVVVESKFISAPPPTSSLQATQALALRLFAVVHVGCLTGRLYYQVPQRWGLMCSQRSDIAAGSHRPLPSMLLLTIRANEFSVFPPGLAGESRE